MLNDIGLEFWCYSSVLIAFANGKNPHQIETSKPKSAFSFRFAEFFAIVSKGILSSYG